MKKIFLMIAVVTALVFTNSIALADEPPVSFLESIDENWNTYTNFKLGFEIQVPNKASYGKLKIIEKGNIVYLVADKDYQYKAIKKSLKSKAVAAKRVRGIPWAILVKKAKNDKQLTALIKQKYGSGCKLAEKVESHYPGTFNVLIEGDGKDLDKTKCPLNFITYMMYSPKLQRVATWDIGQSPNFEIDGFGDDMMSDSFTFIDQ